MYLSYARLKFLDYIIVEISVPFLIKLIYGKCRWPMSSKLILNLHMTLQWFVNSIKNILPNLYYIIDSNIIEKIFNFVNDYIVDKENYEIFYIVLYFLTYLKYICLMLYIFLKKVKNLSILINNISRIKKLCSEKRSRCFIAVSHRSSNRYSSRNLALGR